MEQEGDKEKEIISQFESRYSRQHITEYESAYINMALSSYYLHFLKNVYDRYHHEFFLHGEIKIQLFPFSEEIQDTVHASLKTIFLITNLGNSKANHFVQYKFTEISYFYQELIHILRSYNDHLQTDLTFQIYQKKSLIKQLIKILYGLVFSMLSFIELNSDILQYIVEVEKLYYNPFVVANLIKNKSVYHALTSQVRTTYISNQNKAVNSVVSEQQLKEVEIDIKEEFQQNRTSLASSMEDQKSMLQEHQEEDGIIEKQRVWMEKAKKNLTKIYQSLQYLKQKDFMAKLEEYVKLQTKKVSNKNHFLLGLYIGLGAVIIAALSILLIFDFLEFESEDQSKIYSMKFIFPMFRGVGLLILYLWGMAWNVYGFTTYKINFRVILEYGTHYSNHFQIMKRAGFFTLVFAIMLFLYLLGLNLNSHDPGRQLPVQYSPFVVWTLYFLYIFFPNRQMFNPKGRKYFYSLLRKIIMTPFVKMSFLLSFASDQAVSFVIPIKDFAYTICFYTSEFNAKVINDRCLVTTNNAGINITGISIAYGVALIPLVIRMIQCYNQAKQSNGYFINHLQMWNFFKYSASVLTVTLGFFYGGGFSGTKDQSLRYYFIISSVFSTLYSYYWDLKNDWGFLEKDAEYKFLRNKLCYRPSIYYLAICFNLLFRCAWTLSIVPAVVEEISKPFLPLLTGLIEVFRRCMWNFFRIEKEHVLNCHSFTIIKKNPHDILNKIANLNEEQSTEVENTESMLIPLIHIYQEQNSQFRQILDEEHEHVRKEDIQVKKMMFLASLEKEKKFINKVEIKRRKKVFYNIKEKFY